MAIRQRRLFQSESVERKAKKNMVQGEEDQNEEVFLVALTAHEERLLFVRRAAHALPHTPRLALTATPEGSMEVRVKIYDGLLLTRLLQRPHQLKVATLLAVLQTYRALVSCNGPFLLTPAHLRCDSHLQFVLWLHPNFLSNRPSHPLPAQPNADRLMTSCLVGLLGPLFRTSFFKYKAVSSLSELEQYLAFVARRNHLHKKCNHIVREKSLSKRKTTMSLRNLRLPETSTIMFGRPSLHRRQGMMGSVMSRGSFCDQGSRAEQWLGRLDVSKVFGQPKNPETEMDTLETEQLSRKAKSHLQLSAFLLHSQKQSCIFGSLQHPPRHSHIQRSSILTRTQPQRPSTRFCPVRIKRTPTQPPELDRRGELAGNFLSLSEISEDPENEVGGSDLKRKQQTLLDIVEEFQNFLLC